MTIHVLPPEIASQIAAGEVVERPASVVKELIENALDAQASQIDIHIEEAGRALIEVSDNGLGIPAEELSLTVARHATSKLASADDLFNISTLGFRGEALASIASVSRFTLTSRPPEAPSASRLTVDGGLEQAVESLGAPVGTTVRVQELFYNVPARLEFLKKDVTERRNITSLVTRYALAYPNVRFQLTYDGKPALQTSGDGDRRAILASLYRPDIARHMLTVDGHYPPYSVEGFTTPTHTTRASRRQLSFFVNGRWVQDAALSAAVVQAYHTLLMVGRFPISVLFIHLPPSDVDVNVHPAKSEVRFRYPDRIFSAVQRSVRSALLAHTPIPVIDPSLRWSPSTPLPEPSRLDLEAASEQEQNASQEKISGGTSDTSSTTLPGTSVPLLRLVGQVGSAYLVAEGPDGLYLVDQHAAHERVLFERFMAQSNAKIPSQTLLEPHTVELDPESASLLEEQLPHMHKLGFQIESFGPHTYKMRAMPSLLLGSDPEAALRVVVEDFEEDETPLQSEVEARLVARICKRAAVKAGKILSPQEQQALLSDLEACRSPRTCPHGRPTMIHLSIDLLERQFGRKGAR
ncbi:MAG: DNA mismatch repair endonuclease MutL [Anaerolineae bacterium]|nr:DNA mismatch repair endonuclease MutL [Anaerolineae bacterium]